MSVMPASRPTDHFDGWTPAHVAPLLDWIQHSLGLHVESTVMEGIVASDPLTPVIASNKVIAKEGEASRISAHSVGCPGNTWLSR